MLSKLVASRTGCRLFIPPGTLKPRGAIPGFKSSLEQPKREPCPRKLGILAKTTIRPPNLCRSGPPPFHADMSAPELSALCETLAQASNQCPQTGLPFSGYICLLASKGEPNGTNHFWGSRKKRHNHMVGLDLTCWEMSLRPSPVTFLQVTASPNKRHSSQVFGNISLPLLTLLTLREGLSNERKKSWALQKQYVLISLWGVVLRQALFGVVCSRFSRFLITSAAFRLSMPLHQTRIVKRWLCSPHPRNQEHRKWW